MALPTTSFIVPSYCFTSSSTLRSKPPSKSQTLKFNPNISLPVDHHTSRYSSSGKRALVVFSSLLPDVPLPSGPPSDSWKSWILGAAITIILPFLTHKWGPLLQIAKRIETMVETADQVAEVIEKVADEVEKVADEIGDKLPEGGKLRGAFDVIENAARKTANGADLVDKILDQVEEVEEQVEELMEPVNHPANDTAN